MQLKKINQNEISKSKQLQNNLMSSEEIKPTKTVMFAPLDTNNYHMLEDKRFMTPKVKLEKLKTSVESDTIESSALK